MNEIAKQGDSRMTVREVAEILGVDISTVTKRVRELFPQKVRNGVTTYLDEAEVTLLKMELQHNGHLGQLSEVVAMPKTDLEKELIVQQALVYQQEKINALTDRLAIAEPKAEILDKITATDSDVSVRGLASILAVPDLGQKNLFKKLRVDGYIDGFNHPYRQYIESGIMYEKEYYIPQLEETKPQLRITQKGVAYFAKRYGRVSA
jgi:phage antirepressor YoqD-like protein